MLTVSEELFEQYCTLRGYPFKRIDTSAREGRLPDYEVQTPRGAVICEVKELVPKGEDKEIDDKLKKYLNPPFNRRPTGKRARATLKAARGQRKRFGNKPCILVIFDTTYHNYLTPADIDAAMYGDPLVFFSIDPPGHELDFTHGGNRGLTEERGLYIGALAVLCRGEFEGGVRLDIYHNWSASVSKRISRAYFPDLRDRHFIKNGHPDESGHGWYEYAGRRKDA